MGVNMKKIIICLFCLIAFNAHATEMCARRDLTVVPLDSSVPRTGWYTDSAEHVFWVSFEFGTIYGGYGCFALQEIRDIENNQSLTANVSVLSNSDDDYIGNSGWYQGNTTGGPDYERIYCYCKMTHPMSSRWVNYGGSSREGCLAFCNGECYYRVRDRYSSVFNNMVVSVGK